jgi:hypothetical protein
VSDAEVVGRVDLASESDIPGWLALASEVDELFGAPMSTDPLFEALVLKNIRRGTALVVRERHEPATGMIGAALWSPASRRIGWLVVARAWLGRGIGTMLVDAIAAAAGEGPLQVVTFAPDSAKKFGRAASTPTWDFGRPSRRPHVNHLTVVCSCEIKLRDGAVLTYPPRGRGANVSF